MREERREEDEEDEEGVEADFNVTLHAEVSIVTTPPTLCCREGPLTSTMEDNPCHVVLGNPVYSFTCPLCHMTTTSHDHYITCACMYVHYYLYYFS